MIYVNKLREGDRIKQIFLMRARKTAVSKAGKPYETLTLQDKTGALDAKIWDIDNGGIESVDAPAYVEVSGDISKYMGKLQMSVKRLRKADSSEYNEADYMPVSPYPIDQMYENIEKLIDGVEEEHLKALLDSFFRDEDFKKAFCTHSAAKSVHHGFVGGLLQHTFFVARTCDFLSRQYPQLNHDLLVTAALCHDIGKLKELSTFPENDYTDEGQLIGHIVIGIEMITEKIRDIEGFPKTLATELKHCIAAHHGEFEFGSPKKPALIEAVALNYADNIDARMEIFKEALDAATPDSYEFLGFNNFLGSNIRRTH